MRLPSIPGPSDVVAAVTGARDGMADALALVPRAASVLGRVEELLDQVSALLARALRPRHHLGLG